MENMQTMKVIREILASSRNLIDPKLKSLVQLNITIDFMNLYHKYPQETEKIVIDYTNQIKVYDYHIKRLILKHRFNYNNPCMGYNVCNTKSCLSKQPDSAIQTDQVIEGKERYCLNSLLKINHKFSNANNSIKKLNMRDCFRLAGTNELYFVEGRFFLLRENTKPLFKSFRCTNHLCRSPDTVLEIGNFLYYYSTETNSIELIFDSKHSKECRACLTLLQESFKERQIEKSYDFRLSEEAFALNCVTVCNMNYVNDECIGALGNFTRGLDGNLIFCALKTWQIYKETRSIKSYSIELTTKFIFNHIKNNIDAQDLLMVIILSTQLFCDSKVLIYTADVIGTSRIVSNFFAIHRKNTRLLYTNIICASGIYINDLSMYKNKIDERAHFVFIFRRNDGLCLRYEYERKTINSTINDEGIVINQNIASLNGGASTTSCDEHCPDGILLKHLDTKLFTELQIIALRIYTKNNHKISISRIIYTLNHLIIGYRSLISRNIDKEDLLLIEKLVTDKLV